MKYLRGLAAAAILIAGSTSAAAATQSTEHIDGRLSTSAAGVSSVTGEAAGVSTTWQVGVRAGTTTFTSAPSARCQPRRPNATLAQRRCILEMQGRFLAEDRGWHGRYQGRASVVYSVQEPGAPAFDTAAFDSGTVTYFVRRNDGQWLGRLDMYVDLGTGGVYGFPGDLDISYWIEERNEMVGVLNMTGVGINALNADLRPVRRYIDRLAYS